MVEIYTLLWAGMTFGVSFIATPIKFKAKSLTMPVALDVGKATFDLLYKIESLFTFVLVALIIAEASINTLSVVELILITIFVFIYLIQSFYLRPKLMVRTDRIIAGEDLPRSSLHKYFAILQAARIGNLIALGLLVSI